jgi:NodT family efflux transporter outer membrane factor (OMF) lipoprotein
MRDEGGAHGCYPYPFDFPQGRPSPLPKSAEGKSCNAIEAKNHLVLSVIALLLLSSCTVGPDYFRPAARVPPNYKEIDGWKVAQPKDSVIRGTWWEVFNDPELNGLEGQVDVSNQNIAAAEATFRQARALVQEARANYFPTITVGVGVTNSSKSTTIQGSSSGQRITPTQYSLPVDVSWEIDVWGRIRRAVESAQAGAQASAADVENARLSAQAELAQDYFQLRALDAQKHLLDETVAEFQKSLDLTRNRYASGVASRADVLQAETQLKTTQAQAVDVGVQRAQLEHAIALLIGKTPAEVSVSVSPLSTQPPAIPVGLPSELLERRPDIAGAERRVAQANAQIGIAEAAYFPTVSLAASGGFQSTSFGQWISAPSRFWSVGPTITETVFDGGLRRAQTAEARAVYDTGVALYRQSVLAGFQQVEDNIAALRILENEAQIQDEAVKSAQQTVVVVTNQYKAGITSYLNVITAQTAALDNERTAINILGNRLNASVLLIKALGGGWDASKLP